MTTNPAQAVREAHLTRDVVYRFFQLRYSQKREIMHEIGMGDFKSTDCHSDHEFQKLSLEEIGKRGLVHQFCVAVQREHEKNNPEPVPPPAALSPTPDNARLVEALRGFRDHVITNATQWKDGGGSHHHPIWQKVAAALTPSPPAQEGFDLLAHLARQREWSGNTFGPGPRTGGVIDHIRKELREIEADPSDISEWIDVVILALDGAWRAGFQPQQIIDALVAKQSKNEARQWPDWRTASPDKAIEHVRGRTEHSEIMKAVMGEDYDELE